MAAASNNNDSLTSQELLGAILADELQEQMLEGPESVSQTAVSSAQRVINDFENLILPINNDNSSITTVNGTLVTPDPNLVATATSVIDALDEFENRLSSVCNQDTASNGMNKGESASDDHTTSIRRSSTPTGQLQAQTSNLSDDSRQMRSGRHIMISYHHDSSFHICRRICNKLRERGYRVWMDTNNLHGSIHQGMAEAIENSFVVLFFMNHDYYMSEFCKKEALYTDKKHIKFIPCLLQPSYEPEGWLGIIIRDQMFIDFSKLDNFDVAFEELIAEIQAIEEELPISPTQTLNLSPDNDSQRMEIMSSLHSDLSFNNQSQQDSLRTVIRDFRESINQSNHDAQLMTEEEFAQFVNYIRRRIFNNPSPSLQTENNQSRQILEEILQHSQNQTEFLRRITEILSSITETRTIIKLSLAFAFVWAINKFL